MIDLSRYVPARYTRLENPQTELPRMARSLRAMAAIEKAVKRVPTAHELRRCDARKMEDIADGSVHLVVTSPPYWNLKEYNRVDGQLGYVAGYEDFLDELDRVWSHCLRVLVPGGRLVVVVGDVCLSRRKNKGRHTVVPLHASIQERCRAIGFDNLAPIIWKKIANATYEVEGGSGFLGKPYEPNAVIKNDVEYILMQRKPGGYRSPSVATRTLSMISAENHGRWFQQVWSDVPGTSTRNHPAPFPIELAERLVRMFSFVGDTVLDPFLGSGTTAIAAAMSGRNSLGCEIDAAYLRQAHARFEKVVKTEGLPADVILSKPRAALSTSAG